MKEWFYSDLIGFSSSFVCLDSRFVLAGMSLSGIVIMIGLFSPEWVINAAENVIILAFKFARMSFFDRTSFFVVIIIKISLSSSGMAAIVTWDGGGGNDNWSDPDNWDGNTLPSDFDRVRIIDASVTLNINSTVGSVYLGGSELLVGGPLGRLSMTSFYDYGIELESAKLTIKGKIEVNTGNYNGLKLDMNSIVEVYDTLRISEGGVFNQGYILNEGVVLLVPPMDEEDQYGNGIYNQGQWDNESGSELRIYGPDPLISDFTGILNNGGNSLFTNRGIIWVEHAYDGIRNSGNSFVNWGTIDLHEIKKDGIKNESSNTIFTNHASASIILESASSSIGGFTANIENNAVFINYGNIQILEMSENGIRNLKSFTNAGTITILPSGSLGCIQNDYSNANFINSGMIVINSLSNSISCRGNSVFTNESSGDIHLEGSTTSFRRSLRLWDSAIFTNLGSLTLLPSVDAIFLDVEEGSVFDCQGILDMN